MKQKNLIFPAFVIIIASIMVFPSCAKKKIPSYPSTTTSAEEEARRTAAEEERQRELERQRAIEEESLREESLKQASLSKEIEKERKLTESAMFENEDVHFEFDSITLSPAAQEILRKKARWLSENPGHFVTIEGHCDNRGTNEYNLALGDRRAHSARMFLVDLGIDESRMQTISYGEERPLDPGENEEAWARNRRAHFVINK